VRGKPPPHTTHPAPVAAVREPRRFNWATETDKSIGPVPNASDFRPMKAPSPLVSPKPTPCLLDHPIAPSQPVCTPPSPRQVVTRHPVHVPLQQAHPLPMIFRHCVQASLTHGQPCAAATAHKNHIIPFVRTTIRTDTLQIYPSIHLLDRNHLLRLAFLKLLGTHMESGQQNLSSECPLRWLQTHLQISHHLCIIPL